MRVPGSITAFLLSCAVFSAGGWWLAGSSPWLAVMRMGTEGRAAVVAPLRQVDDRGGRGMKGGELPLTPSGVKRKVIAGATTEKLWRWYLSGENSGIRQPEMFAELVDRLGWAAWDQALALEDPEQRSSATEGVLTELAKRDPWRAFGIWRDHREELDSSLDPYWGKDAMTEALERMGQCSAAQMIEIMQAMKIFDSSDIAIQEGYRADFDFAAVVAFLDQPDAPELKPGDLLEEWGRRSPVAYSQWMLAHTQMLEHAEIFTGKDPWQWETDRALWTLAGQGRDTPGRAEALEILSRLPASYLEKVWQHSDLDTHAGFSPERLEAATQMNQRETYLWGAFSQTMTAGEIDPSWAQLAAEDRQPLLERTEEEKQRQKPTPVQQAAWDRWFRRMKAVWGME